MAPPKRTSSALGGDDGDDPQDAAAPTSSDDVLALAEEAEAEAAEAEALAAAARARARALRLRREAASAAASAPTSVEPVPAAEPTEAAEIGEPDEPAATVEPAATSRQRRLRLPRPSLALAAAALAVALTVGFVAAGVYMTLHHQRVVAQQEQSAEFAAAARQGVVTLMSLDFTRAEEDVQRIIDNTTGDFRKDFEGQAEIFTQVAQESKVITEATVNSVAVASMTQDTATVLVAVTTNVSNAASQEQQPRSWRLSVDVARDAGQIKLAKVEFVP
jgi:Mce-associated membrane protein